jgi:hypothetical protein
VLKIIVCVFLVFVVGIIALLTHNHHEVVLPEVFALAGVCTLVVSIYLGIFRFVGTVLGGIFRWSKRQ